ncbi:hypothetical protein HYX03_04255 [Candidatus Woesearchaeota archaeon]|nr:hypothetical protein [Candidatus Woesearchaeota archaeon]
MKGVVMFLMLIIFLPLVFSISIKELISRYSFYAVTGQMNVTNFTDFMVDKNNNGLNDTLVLEFTTNNAAGNFIFAVDLFDKDGILTNKTNNTLASGINKINATFSSILLTQSRFNYSIKVYNSTHSLKYRKDNILTQNYSGYEEGFRVTVSKDSKINKTLRINITLNSPINGTHRTTLFLSYNNSVIFSKEDKLITSSINHLLFNFGNETLKRTHFIGNFTVSSVKIGRKAIKTNFATSFYDFRDFASTSYIYNFSDNGSDTNNNAKYDILEINACSQIEKQDNYTVAIDLYDLFGNIVEAKNTSYYLNSGKNTITININGSLIYAKKLNGPFAVKSIELFENGTLVDQLKDAYVTSNYNFNDLHSRTQATSTHSMSLQRFLTTRLFLKETNQIF